LERRIDLIEVCLRTLNFTSDMIGHGLPIGISSRQN
jgi:hypothetical protein